MTANEEVFVWTSVRYALGRMSYVVSMVTESVIEVWPQLSEKVKYTIQQDVEEAIKNGNTGMDMDLKRWLAVRELWKARVEEG